MSTILNSPHGEPSEKEGVPGKTELPAGVLGSAGGGKLEAAAVDARVRVFVLVHPGLVEPDGIAVMSSVETAAWPWASAITSFSRS